MHRLKIFTFLTVSFLLVSNGIAQQKILLSKAKIHVGNGKVINQGLVGIDGEEIVLVENALTFTYDKTAWDTIIDLKGQELYPGFIAPNSTLGLTEVDAVRATRDFNEVGVFNPHVRSQIAFNAESEINTTVKTNGVLYTQTTPQGGIISGTSSLMKLEAWNWEDATLKKDDGIHLNWPSTTKGGGWWAEPAPKKINDKYTEDVIKIRNFFEAALAYSESDDLYDARFEAMRAVFTGTKRVYFHANELRALTDIIDFKREFSIQYPVIIGGYEAYKIADQLIDAEIPIIIKGGHTLPANEDDPVDLPYRLPALLQEAGILFCIQNSGRMETMNTRNIPFLAGTAMAYGLSEEQAISAVSLNTAKIMGIDQIAGSIEVGKKATLFASKGSALDMRTNELTLGMIHGKFIQLTNLQTKLYEKYKEKYKSK